MESKEKFAGKYRSESNRLRERDYSSPGLYFIILCTKNRERMFGEIKNGEMQLSGYGEIVRNEILKIENYNKSVYMDEWIVMPDHIHLLIEIINPDIGGKIHEFSRQGKTKKTEKAEEAETTQYRKERRKMIISMIIGKLKMITSKEINIERETPGYSNWQPDYYDHIVRNEKSYLQIKNYIINNPQKWKRN